MDDSVIHAGNMEDAHIISNDEVLPSKSETTSIRNFPIPTTQKELQSFLGLTGYLRKFNPGVLAYRKTTN
ncbi:hypothetical protein PV325_007125 [Microctonus aethiopoides]|nr:hypothetical protein PV325_007125 [Microctonus aethiopoides]